MAKTRNCAARLLDCMKHGHDWAPDGTRFDCDGGMGGGRELYAYRCRRCGKTRTSITDLSTIYNTRLVSHDAGPDPNTPDPYAGIFRTPAQE